jgi:acetyl-CoA hydrolase
VAKELTARSIDFSEIVRLGDTVLWGQGGAEPLPLTNALMEQRHRIGRFEVFLGFSHSQTPKIEFTDCVSFSSYCGTGSNRELVKAGKLGILRQSYSEMSALLSTKVDVLLLQLAPTEHDDQFSFGIAHEYLVPLIQTARTVVAEINDQCPSTRGERSVRYDDIDYFVRTSRPPLKYQPSMPGPVEIAIARHAATLIDDGATIQMGLGTLPELVLANLKDRRDLGIHSGAVNDTAAALMLDRVITNARKPIDRGLTVGGILLGGRRIYEFAHHNPSIQLRATSYTHNRAVLRQLDHFVAINSAIEIDLAGQINSEVANGVHVGAVGGAGEFLQGAALSRGGLPIVVLPSTATTKGVPISRIVTRLSGPASTSLLGGLIVVTEYGVADLRGLSFDATARRLIEIAHPNFQTSLWRSYETERRNPSRGPVEQ